MMMKLALNLSAAAEDLLQQGRIELDLFKCPAWPDLVERTRQRWPLYVHFPLAVGRGDGEAINTETHAKVDWAHIEPLLAGTATRHINVHLAAKTADFPSLAQSAIHLPPSAIHTPSLVDLAAKTADFPDLQSIHNPHSAFRNPAQVELVADNLVRDVMAVVKRFGADRVIAENIFSGNGNNLPQSFLPEVITRVITETGCGLLFDLSHARLAAQNLNLPPKEYIEQLPMQQVREIHVTGIQKFDGVYSQRLREAGVAPASIHPYEGRLMDHLPMLEEDWQFLHWAVERIRSGAWGKPWVVTFEYGGVNSWWAAITDPAILESQVPRLRKLIGF